MIKNFFKSEIKIKSKLLLIFLIGVILRSYNINYEDFWIDEIVSFWSANPKYDGLEWISRLSKGDLHIFFNFLLKYYFNFFAYKIELARYFPLIISILTLISVLYLSVVLRIENITLIFFLFSFNIYLIKFSQELRSYSLVVFLTSIILIFFFKIVENNKFNKNYLNFFFIVSQIFLILTHVFGLLIFFALLSYNLIYFIKKKNNIHLIISNIIVGIFSFFFTFIYLKYFKLGVDWLPQIENKFYTNFFFSKFFGSRLLGLLHLILLIYLIIKSKIILSKKNDPKIILILIIIISYLLPIIFSYSIKPILQDKYIIFVIIPILIITVDFLKFIENNIKKKIIIFFLYTITILNLFTETTVRQFFFDRPIHKPDLKSTFIQINKSVYKNYSFNLEITWTDEKIMNDILKNYTDIFANKMNMTLHYKDYTSDHSMIKNLNSDYLWLICLYDLNGKICSIPKNLKNSKILTENNFNSVNLKLLKF